jgi:hypothetical protein
MKLLVNFEGIIIITEEGSEPMENNTIRLAEQADLDEIEKI